MGFANPIGPHSRQVGDVALPKIRVGREEPTGHRRKVVSGLFVSPLPIRSGHARGGVEDRSRAAPQLPDRNLSEIEAKIRDMLYVASVCIVDSVRKYVKHTFGQIALSST